MSIFNAEIYQEEVNVLQVRSNTTLSRIQKREMIHEIRKGSMVQMEGNSSTKTILNLTNINFGFTLLVFGLQLKSTGFFFGLLAFLISMGITLKTSLMQLIHCRSQDTDFNEVVERVMGEKARKIHIASAIFYINLNILINFVYSVDMLYWTIGYFVEMTGGSLPSKDVLTFETFSYQYTGMIMFVFFNLCFLIKDIKSLAILGPVGVLSVCVVVIFSVVEGAINVSNFPEIFTFQFNISDVAILLASMSMGFFGHYYHLPILNSNKNKENNRRDLVISFILTGFLFFVDALFGSVALADKEIANPVSLLDFFSKTWYILVIRVMILVQLITAVIFTTFLMKAKLWSLFPENRIITTQLSVIVNLIFTSLWLVIQIFNVDISTLITLAGGLGALMGIYFFPIIVHLKSIYTKKVDNQTAIFEEKHQQSINLLAPSDRDDMYSKDRTESMFYALSTISEKDRAFQMHQNFMKTPKILRFAGYFSFIVVGIFILVVRVYAMFDK